MIAKFLLRKVANRQTDRITYKHRALHNLLSRGMTFRMSDTNDKACKCCKICQSILCANFIQSRHNWFEPSVWQKQVFAGIRSTLLHASMTGAADRSITQYFHTDAQLHPFLHPKAALHQYFVKNCMLYWHFGVHKLTTINTYSNSLSEFVTSLCKQQS